MGLFFRNFVGQGREKLLLKTTWSKSVSWFVKYCNVLYVILIYRNIIIMSCCWSLQGITSIWSNIVLFPIFQNLSKSREVGNVCYYMYVLKFKLLVYFSWTRAREAEYRDTKDQQTYQYFAGAKKYLWSKMKFNVIFLCVHYYIQHSCVLLL